MHEVRILEVESPVWYPQVSFFVPEASVSPCEQWEHGRHRPEKLGRAGLKSQLLGRQSQKDGKFKVSVNNSVWGSGASTSVRGRQLA